ncbi:hypothetical protein HMPREF1503_1622 [Olsenella uli MSTE5]|nr:hypothetical protein HMPREF1503_1622 [Olsenella uli MSTE5]
MVRMPPWICGGRRVGTAAPTRRPPSFNARCVPTSYDR